MENVKKCKNFLSTLIKLASSGKQSTETAANVKELVQHLLVRASPPVLAHCDMAACSGICRAFLWWGGFLPEAWGLGGSVVPEGRRP